MTASIEGSAGGRLHPPHLGLQRGGFADTGVTLVDMDEVFTPDDLSLFASDRTHPSEHGSTRIAALVAPLLAR